MSGRYCARRLVNEGSREDVPPVQMGAWIANKDEIDPLWTLSSKSFTASSGWSAYSISGPGRLGRQPPSLKPGF